MCRLSLHGRCSSHGSCSATGLCICDAGWSGAGDFVRANDCAVSLPALVTLWVLGLPCQVANLVYASRRAYGRWRLIRSDVKNLRSLLFETDDTLGPIRICTLFAIHAASIITMALCELLYDGRAAFDTVATTSLACGWLSFFAAWAIIGTSWISFNDV